MFTTPGFIMGLIALEFVYGLFLFAVMSTNKRHREEAKAKAATELLAKSESAGPPLTPKLEPEPKPEAAVKPEAAGDSPAKTGTTVAREEKAKGDPEPSKAGAASNPSVAPNPAVVEAPPSPATNAKPKEPSKPDTKTDVAKNNQVALATHQLTPTKVEAVAKAPLSLFPELGPLIDPLQDSSLKRDDDTLTIQVAPGPHIFDANRDIVDAPRSLAEVEGDFTVEVKFLGDLQPGTVPLKGLPFTFQGAGLLLWQNKENYVRFERAAAYTGERFQWIYLESCKDGKLTKPKKPMNVREGAITLRLERHGNAINYTYSLDDGKTFLKVDQFSTTLPRKMSVGIAANNASPRGFTARFTDFVLKPSS